MRRKLARFHGTRALFYATFECYVNVNRNGTIKRCMLIQDIRDVNGKFIAEHCWMPLRKEDKVHVPLERGDKIRFWAEVELYTKGTRRRRYTDYGLCRPAGVMKVLEQEEMEA